MMEERLLLHLKGKMQSDIIAKASIVVKMELGKQPNQISF